MDELKNKVLVYLEALKTYPTALDWFIGKPDNTPKIVSKNQTISEKARKEGNSIFLQNGHNSTIHHKILQLYNQSIGFAPNGSEELALAYGNKSALLRHVRKYTESIIEADKALKITECVLLKVKLLCRKADCYTALGSSENRHCIEKARFLYSKSNDPEEVKMKMSDLITQTQLVIDADKLDEPKKNWKRAESMRIVAEAEKSDVWSYIKIEYNKKYGRHLTAARDFEPGDLVLVEKPFMNHLDQSKVYMYCSHCWDYLWTTYPCDTCAWRLFCSEQCKNEALSEYHDMECLTLVRMKEDSLLETSCMIPFLISAFVKAMKQAGSIARLQKDLKSIDECKDERKKNFFSSQTFKDYIAIYNLPFPEAEGLALSAFMGCSVIAMVGLAQHSKLFKTTYKSNDYGKLMNDDFAVFAAAFMVKIFMLTNSRSTSGDFFDPNEVDKNGNNENPKGKDYRYKKSFAIRSYGFHAVAACVPNVDSHLTYNNKHVIYALSPIKKGSPIMGSVASIYHKAPKNARQTLNVMRTDIKSTISSCHCQACSEDWDEILKNDEIFLASINTSSLGMDMYEEIDQIYEEIQTKSHRLSFPDAKLLSRMKNCVAKSWKYFPMPSRITFKAVSLLMELFQQLFSPQSQGLEKIETCKI